MFIMTTATHKNHNHNNNNNNYDDDNNNNNKDNMARDVLTPTAAKTSTRANTAATEAHRLFCT